MAINDITGDTIASKLGDHDKYSVGHDLIWGKKPSDGQCKRCGGILIRDKCESCKSETTQAD